MTIERILRGMAGFMILLSLGLAQFHSHWWLLLAVFVALNLLQSAFTNSCPAMFFLRILGFKHCEAPDARSGRGHG